jgi:hypothetical protein
MNMPTSIILKILAPIAIKSEVTVLYMESAKLFGGWQPAEPLVYDHQSGILYGPEWMPLELTPEEARESFSFGDYRRSQAPPLRARVLQCTVRSKGWGEQNDLKTRLLLEPITEDETPYRG